ncbi:hypothetical protein TYRP_013823 [Tyrophagus putrescentiae]|nr:hypothetical protein TYRP_013823 [Tyrophagus putrescentiae]
MIICPRCALTSESDDLVEEEGLARVVVLPDDGHRVDGLADGVKQSQILLLQHQALVLGIRADELQRAVGKTGLKVLLVLVVVVVLFGGGGEAFKMAAVFEVLVLEVSRN